MHLPESRRVAADLLWLDEVTSTNDVLRELVAESASQVVDRMVVATASQTAGRGRLGRAWVAPPGKTLAVSVLVRDFSALTPGWLPLIAGSAVRRGIRDFVPRASVGVKWPNDVLIDGASGGKKVSGILSEMLPDGSIIVGIGVNILLTEEDLPTERATSLLLHAERVSGGHPALAEKLAMMDAVLASILRNLYELLDWVHAGEGAALERVRSVVTEDSATLGTDVRALLPAGTDVQGQAVSLADDGALVIRTSDGSEVVVAAGDIEHLR